MLAPEGPDTPVALTRPASGSLRRPICLFRPVKPTHDAYRLPQDARTRAARQAADRGDRPDARNLARLVDWSPTGTWGPLVPPSPAA